MAFIKKEIKSEKLVLKLEIELNKSSLTPGEAADRISYAIKSYRWHAFSDFVLGLLRETQSSTYEIKVLTID